MRHIGMKIVDFTTRNTGSPAKAGVPASANSWPARPRSIGSASESSPGLMGSERVRRHPHHRD